jgi:peptidoglycan/LPS O-acetylase OafA/YrhL
MEGATPLNPKHRFHELDLLRFVAAMSVVLFHYTHYGLIGGYMPYNVPALAEVFQYGYLGLDFLFMVSGFVILMTVQRRNWAGFVSSRVVRLYPTYWVCMAVTAVVVLLANDPRYPASLSQVLANLTMFQTRFGFEHIDGVYWTLETELVFYAWVFLVCLIKQIHNADKILGLWAVASIVINLFGGITFTGLDLFLLPSWSFYFIAGGAFYLTYQRGRSLYLSILIGVSYVMVVKLAVADPERLNPYVAFAGDTLLFLVFAYMVSGKRRPVEKPWMATLGAITYPLYLIHQNIGYLALSELDGLLPRPVALLLVLTVMVAVSYVLATQIENRFTPPFRRIVNHLLRLVGARESGQRVGRTPAREAASAT